MYKSIKYRLFPNPVQKNELDKIFGSCRFVYNWALGLKQKTYEESGVVLVVKYLQPQLNILIQQTPWLQKVSPEILRSSLNNLELAYKNYFKKRAELPTYKNRIQEQGFRIHKGYKIDTVNKFLILENVGEIRIENRVSIHGQIKNVTVKRSSTGKYYASFCIEDNEIEEYPPIVEKEKAIGIDLGIHDLVVCSNGLCMENKRFHQKSEAKLNFLKRKLQLQKEGSNGYKKTKHQISLLIEKIHNQRNDYYHHLTTQLTTDPNITTICVEDLSVSKMLRDKKMRKQISDASFYTFRRMLEYKCLRNGVNFIPIGRYEPTSKTCNCCGAINEKLSLDQREWICPNCGAHLNRDYNAACNIRDVGLRGLI